MGKRADAVFVSDTIVFLIEFKEGAGEHSASALDQVEDYALDLKNFHEGSHTVPIVPILVSTNAPVLLAPSLTFAEDLVAEPIATNSTQRRMGQAQPSFNTEKKPVCGAALTLSALWNDAHRLTRLAARLRRASSTVRCLSTSFERCPHIARSRSDATWPTI